MGVGSFLRRIAEFFGRGRSVRELANRLGMAEKELRAVPIEYDRFYLRKRSGGLREIHAPVDALKRVQRRILRRILGGLRSHPAATAFERGRSIVDNAKPHAGHAVVLNLDLVGFFPSTRAERVKGLFRRCRWGRAAQRLLTDLCTHEGCLPQGAPTSPRLSNLVNLALDRELERFATHFGAAYTRYADDITFSFPEDDRRGVHAVIRLAGDTLRRFGYTVHRRKKLSIRRAHQRQEVTGLVVNRAPNLPRETRRWLRAVKHRFAENRTASIGREQFTGWLAFERMVRGPMARRDP